MFVMNIIVDVDVFLYFGLMLGISVDGIDVVLVQFFVDGGCCFVYGLIVCWELVLCVWLVVLGEGGLLDLLEEFGELDVCIVINFVEVVNQLLVEVGVDCSQVCVIGLYGQIVCYCLLVDLVFIVQLGDGNCIVELIGIIMVFDFCCCDVVVGGYGVLLMLVFYLGMLGVVDEDCVVFNLGGIVNLILILCEGVVCGFDMGFVNVLMDVWCQCYIGCIFDVDGVYVVSGVVDEGLLVGWCLDLWFVLLLLKSIGCEQFYLVWVEVYMEEGEYVVVDVQVILLELIVMIVVDVLLVQQLQIWCLLVCGGGVCNWQLMKWLVVWLLEVQVEFSVVYGLDLEYVEVMGFVWLVQCMMDGLVGNLLGVIGVKGSWILGVIYLV